MSRQDPLRISDYLEHVLEAIKRITEYTENITETAFLNNTQAQDAVIRNFEVIGEACRNIDRHHPEFSNRHPEIPLLNAYKMRNALSHGYFQIDLEIVWKTIENDLPELEKQVRAVYKSL